MQNTPILYFSYNMRITNKRVGGGDYWWENKSIQNKPNQEKEKPLGIPKPFQPSPRVKPFLVFTI
jgi:hypothetical protein